MIVFSTSRRNLIGVIVLLMATGWVVAAGADPPTYENTTDIPPEVTTPDKVPTSLGTLEFFDGVPTGDTIEKVYDFVDRARAVEVFINMTPAVSMYNIRKGQRNLGHTKCNQIVIAEQMGDSKPLVLTWNNTSLYTWGFLDLKKDGPTVIEIPPDVLGILDDMYFRYITDMGAAGPDRGKGGKYLILPPGYEGDVPDGYYVFESKTYGVWNFMRGYVRDSVEAAAKNIKENLKVYPLSRKDNPPRMEFLNMSGRGDYQTIAPNDFSFYEDVHALVQEEADGWADPELLGQCRAIGIQKGKPFAPDARMKKILTEAVAVANATARAIFWYERDKSEFLYEGSYWKRGYPGNNYQFLKNEGMGGRNMDARTSFYYFATINTPAMAMKLVGAGSQYAWGYLDSNGNYLDGSKTYRMNIPKDPPAEKFWSVCVYDPQTRSMLQTDQTYPSKQSQRDKLITNDDGSIDLYFGPTAPAGKEANWTQTVPGKGWFCLLRLYSPTEAWFDKTWRPGEIELVN